MKLTLELSLPRERIPLGSEIATRLTLTNHEPTAIELASLFDNNAITNYLLSDADDRPIVRVNHITRQLLLEKTEPRTTDERVERFEPGASEVRDDNFCLYHWLDAPGIYHLRGLYTWRNIELTTAPVRFELTRAPLCSLDAQWAYHYAEKFLLHSVWVSVAPEGGYELVLRESIRFRPQVINSNRPLFYSREPIFPRVSFNRSLVAGAAVWTAWLKDDSVVCLRSLGGELIGGPFIHSVQRPGAAWSAPPITHSDGTLTLLLHWPDDHATQVLILRIGADGAEIGRSQLPLPSRAERITGVPDLDGGFRLLWASTTPPELFAQKLDLALGTALGFPERVAQLTEPLLNVITPPVFNSEGYFCTVAINAKDKLLVLQWWSAFDPQDSPVKTEQLSLPDAEPILECTGDMNDAGHPFLLLRRPRRLEYVNGALLQGLELARDAALDPVGTERLIITPRNDLHLSMGKPDIGIHDRLIHLGRDFDLSERTT